MYISNGESITNTFTFKVTSECNEMGDIIYDIETKHIHRVKKPVELPKGGLGVFAFEHMQKYGDKVAQIDAQSGEKDTYADFLKRCIRTAIEMKKMGIQPGDVVSICSHNHLNSAVPHLAAQFLGAVIASTDPTISAADSEYLMNLVKPKLMFANEASCDMMTEIFEKLDNPCEVIVFGEHGNLRQFSEFITPKDDEDDFKPYFVEDMNKTAIIFFSSGTTGYPKGTCISHNYMLYNQSNLVLWNDAKIVFGYATLYWISTNMLLFYAIWQGNTRLLTDSFKPSLFWTYAEKYEVEFVFMAPAQAIMCLKVMPEDLKLKLTYFLLGGSAISPTYLQELRDKLPTVQITVGYGQTETGISTVFAPQDTKYMHKLESCGKPMPGFIFKVVDPDTEETLGFNQEGELRVKGPYLLNGYYLQDSRDSWDEEGFFKTGDVVSYDEDFCVYITDRLKEMFKYLSWHVIPAKLEAILESHPDVAIAAVIGIPHPEDDNHALGVVILNNGATTTGDEIEKFVEERVDERNRLRAGVRVVKCLPYTPTGKIKRRVLRDMVVQGTI